MLAVYSEETIEEMKTIVRDGASIEASGRNKDDRVMAMALACAAFSEQVQPQLIQRKLTRKVSQRDRKQDT